ncbi:Hypothetical predicted protein, partial [Paramuricea clavata]
PFYKGFVASFYKGRLSLFQEGNSTFLLIETRRDANEMYNIVKTEGRDASIKIVAGVNAIESTARFIVRE